MKFTRKILSTLILFSGVNHLAIASETDKAIQFSSLKVSSAQKES